MTMSEKWDLIAARIRGLDSAATALWRGIQSIPGGSGGDQYIAGYQLLTPNARDGSGLV